MSDKPELPGWHHVPDVPIQVSPFFSWPPDVRRMWPWLRVRWFAIAENMIVLAIALISWAWFQPSLAQAATLSWDWVLMIWLLTATPRISSISPRVIGWR